jgi:thymidine kinase
MTVKIITGEAFSDKTHKLINNASDALKKGRDVLFVNPGMSDISERFKTCSTEKLTVHSNSKQSLDDVIKEFNDFDGFDTVIIDDLSLLRPNEYDCSFEDLLDGMVKKLKDKFGKDKIEIIISVIILGEGKCR